MGRGFGDYPIHSVLVLALIGLELPPNCFGSVGRISRRRNPLLALPHCRRRLGGLCFANPPYVLMALLTGWFASVVFRKD
jgi:hypothetical protein